MKELSFSSFQIQNSISLMVGISFPNVDCAITPHSALLHRERERAMPSPVRSSARPAHARCGRREAGQSTHGGYPLP